MYDAINVRTIIAFSTGLAVAVIAVIVFQSWRVGAAPGDDDRTFVPITPCRLMDTRPEPNRVGSHGKFSTADTRTIKALGTNGNCTIPKKAVALSLNITALHATAPTFLTVWPSGVLPNASSLNPSPGAPPTPNAVTTPLSGAGEFNIYNHAGAVNVIVDINGYHVDNSLKQLAADVAELQAAQPFAVGARQDSFTVKNFHQVVVDLDVESQVAGQVTVVSTASMSQNGGSLNLWCSITEGSTVDQDYRQEWQPLSGVPIQLSGVRTFDVAGGTTTTFRLVCMALGPNPGVTVTLNDIGLSAILTPAP